MKLKKILIRFILITLAVVVLLVAAIPFLLYKNQDKITVLIVENLNASLGGELTIEKSYVSPFKNFPYISIDLNHVKFYGAKGLDHNEIKPIYEMEDVYVGFDFWDILKGQYNVKKLQIEGGHLDLIRHANGDINLLLAKDSGIEENADTSAFHLELKNIHFKDFDISYLDESDGQLILAHFMDADASFKVIPKHIFTFLDADFITTIVTNGDTSFFKNKHFEIHSTMDFDKEDEKLYISPSQVILEKALFKFDGSVDMNEDMLTDIRIYGEKPDFNLFIAFAPDEIAESMKRYKNEGKIYFNASIKGHFKDGHLPFIEADFGCEKAYFLNSQIDKKIDELGFKGYFTNGEKQCAETMEFRLYDVYAAPHKGIFKGNVLIKNFTDPHISMNVFSDLDLEFLGEFLGIEGLKQLKGQIVLNMNFNVDIKVPENTLVKLKEGISSDLMVKDLSFNIPGYPHTIKNVNIHAQMRAGQVEVDKMNLKIGDSDLSLDGWLSDLPAIFHHQQKPIKIKLNAKSNKLIFKELLAHDTTLANATNEEVTDFNIKLAFETSVDNLTNYKNLPQGEFFIEDFYAKLKHYPHTFHDFHADLIIKENTFDLKDFSGEIDKTDFHFNGRLTNYNLWFDEVKKGDTRFEFNLLSHHFALHDLLTYQGENYLPEDYRHEEILEFKVHGDADIFYDSIFRSADLMIDKFEGRMKVHPLKMEKFKGRFHYEDEHLLVENFSGKMGRSDFLMNMAYYTGEDLKIKKRDNYFSLVSSKLDMDQLFNYDEKKTPEDHEAVFNVFEVPFTDMKLQARIQNLNYHKILLKDFNTLMRMQQNHYLYIDSMSMQAAGGNIRMNGYFNGSDPKMIYFKSVMNLDRVNLDQLMVKFDNFGQDYMISDNLHGILSGTITSTVHMHPDLVPVLEDSKAHLDVEIVNGSLVKFAPVHAMADYFKDKNLDLIRFDTLRNKMDLEKGWLIIPVMNINSSLGFIELSGKQSLDLNMEYYISVPLSLVTEVGFKTLFGKKKAEVDPDQVDAIVYRDKNKKLRFLHIKITGTPDDYKFALGKNKA